LWFRKRRRIFRRLCRITCLWPLFPRGLGNISSGRIPRSLGRIPGFCYSLIRQLWTELLFGRNVRFVFEIWKVWFLERRRIVRIGRRVRRIAPCLWPLFPRGLGNISSRRIPRPLRWIPGFCYSLIRQLWTELWFGRNVRFVFEIWKLWFLKRRWIGRRVRRVASLFSGGLGRIFSKGIPGSLRWIPWFVWSLIRELFARAWQFLLISTWNNFCKKKYLCFDVFSSFKNLSTVATTYSIWLLMVFIMRSY
jgi:hypothetical protein